MKKNTSKILCAGLSAAMICSSAIPAFAAEEQEITPDHNAKTQVSANIDSSAVVWLPTSVVLSGKANAQHKYTAEYGVRVQGNIAGEEKITIIPDESVVLKQQGKENVTATITQEKQEFTYSDLKDGATSTSTGTITANSLSAGSWNGSFNFTVSVTSPEKEFGPKIQSWDISKDRSQGDDVWMTYYNTPNESAKFRRSISVEPDKYEDGTVLITGTGEMEDNIAAKYFCDNEKLFNSAIEYLGQQFPDYEFYNWDDHEKVIEEKVKQYPTLESLNQAMEKVLFYEHKSTIKTENEDKAYLAYTAFSGYRINQIPDNYTYIDYSHGENGEATSSAPAPIKAIISKSKTWIDENRIQYIKFNPKKIVIKNEVENISVNAFSNLKSLENIQIGEGVKSIGTMAFSYTSITDLYIPSNVSGEMVMTCAFSGKLKNVIFAPDCKVTMLGDFTSEVIENLVLPNNIQQFGTYAGKIKNLTVPCQTLQPTSMAGSHDYGDYTVDKVHITYGTNGIIPENNSGSFVRPWSFCDKSNITYDKTIKNPELI